MSGASGPVSRRLPLLEIGVILAMFGLLFAVVFVLHARARERAMDAAAVGDLLRGAATAQAYAAENDGRYGGGGLEPFGEEALRRVHGWDPIHSEVVSVDGREDGEGFRIAVRSRSGRLLSYDPSRVAGSPGHRGGPVAYGP